MLSFSLFLSILLGGGSYGINILDPSYEIGLIVCFKFSTYV
jgi:hypothetical protein